MERAKETYIHPGIILKEEVIDANGLSIESAADLLGIPRFTLSEVANAKDVITPIIALKIEKVFGGNATLWLRMQRGYDQNEEKIKFPIKPTKIE